MLANGAHPWMIRPGNIAGYHRVRWIHILGDRRSTHNLNVVIHYEDGTSQTEAFALTSGTHFDIRMKPQYQKAGAFQIELYDSDSGSPYRGAYWYGLSLDMLVKNKFPVGPSGTK